MSKRVMIVEDDDDVRDTLSGVLSEQGFDIVEATDGLDALGQLKRGELPKLILVDLLMPNMDGWKFCDELRATPEFAAIPLVVMTAVGSRGRPPIDGAEVLEKPFELDRVLDLLSRFF